MVNHFTMSVFYAVTLMDKVCQKCVFHLESVILNKLS